MSEGAIKVAVHRLRQPYGEMVRAEIAQTVTNPGEADEELHYLFAAPWFSGIFSAKQCRGFALSRNSATIILAYAFEKRV